MPRRLLKQEMKRRGFLPSFGDIVLPVVGIAGVALLGIAGWHFFIDGIKTQPGISSTKAYAESPVLIAERERVAEIQNEAVKVSEQLENQTGLTQNAQTNPQSVNNNAPEKVSVPQNPQAIKSNTLAAPLQNQNNNQPQAQPKTQTPVQNNKNTQAVNSTPVQTPALAVQVPDPKVRTDYPSNKQYRVQVGAYGSKDGANAEAKKLTKAGFHTTVFTNPASKHVRVWILAGNSKTNAENILERAKSLGYKSSFIVSPSK